MNRKVKYYRVVSNERALFMRIEHYSATGVRFQLGQGAIDPALLRNELGLDVPETAYKVLWYQHPEGEYVVVKRPEHRYTWVREVSSGTECPLCVFPRTWKGKRVRRIVLETYNYLNRPGDPLD